MALLNYSDWEKMSYQNLYPKDCCLFGQLSHKMPDGPSIKEL